MSQEIAVNNRTAISIALNSDDKMLSEVVAGYGEQKEETVTGSVATVKGSNRGKSLAVNLTNSIADQMPGVIATNSSNQPGNARLRQYQLHCLPVDAGAKSPKPATGSKEQRFYDARRWLIVPRCRVIWG